MRLAAEGTSILHIVVVFSTNLECKVMSIELILVIVVLVLLFGGGGGYYWNRRGG